MRFVTIRRAMLTATVLPLALAAATVQADSRTADCPQADHAEVVQTLNRLYAAAGAHDAAGLRSVTSSDFALQEESGRIEGEAVIQRLAGTPLGGQSGEPAEASDAMAAAGTVPPAALAIGNPEVHILCDSAWATFRAPAATGGGDAAGIRSAVLNHQADGWRVRFLNDSIHVVTASETAAARPAGRHAGGSARSRAGTAARSTGGKAHGNKGKAAGGHRAHPKPTAE